MILGVSVENLSILPPSKSIVNQSREDYIVVKVWSLRVFIEVDRMKEDAEPVSREAGDGVGEGDTVTLGASGAQDRRLHES